MASTKLDEPGKSATATEEDVWLHTGCGVCYSPCAIRVHRVNGVVIKIEGDPDFPHNWGRLCAKGHAAIMGLYDPNRVKNPLKRTNPVKGIGVDPGWAEIGWEEALDLIAERMKKIRQDNPNKLGVSNFDTANLPFAYAWGTAFGTGNRRWNAASYFCGAGLHLATYLTNASFHMQIDLERCNYAILFGSQLGFGVGYSPNSTTQKMSDARIRGMRLVVVNPVCTNAGSKADEWVPIRPGTDGALALAMLNVIMNEVGTYDAEYIEKRTNGPYLVGTDGRYVREPESQKPLVWDPAAGRAIPYDSADASRLAIEGSFTVHGEPCQPAFQLLEDHVKRYKPETVSEITTVPATTIRRLAEEYIKAAYIGSTAAIEGRLLPFRPAAVHMYRGAYSHKHSTHQALSIQLLNIIAGNIYAPGGHFGVNPIGPWWQTKEGVDGLLVAHEEIQAGVPPYHFLSTKPEAPESAGLSTLFPITFSSATAEHLAYREPQKYGTPPLEMLIQCRGNIMMTTVDPRAVADVLEKVPFMVSIANLLDETAQFADIVLPDAHSLERVDPGPNETNMSQNPISGYWYWGFRQPVVKPPSRAPHWLDTLIELADRVGFIEDYNRVLSSFVKTRTPLKLEPRRKYTFEELTDIWLKAETGDPDKGLDWFKEHGHLKFKRTVEESFPILAIRQRIPLYYEHFLAARSFVDQVAAKMKITWDTSDYQPLMEWRPCPSFEPKQGFDLFVVNYTLPFHQYSITPENAWLQEISERHPYADRIMINEDTANKRGIKEGAAIWVETSEGRKVKGLAKLTQCIHPEVVAISGVSGAWSDHKPIARGKGSHFNTLLPFDVEHMDPISGSLDACERVRVRPV